MSDQENKPLSLEQVESLLRAARIRDPLQNENDVMLESATVTQDRDTVRSDLNDPMPSESDWIYGVVPTDEVLRQAENNLAAALASETEQRGHDDGRFLPFNYPPLQPTVAPGIPLSSLGEIELDVSLELGQAEMTIGELMALREGSVVTLNRDADQPIDILANGRLIARGEVIVMNDRFCVRICEVINPA